MRGDIQERNMNNQLVISSFGYVSENEDLIPVLRDYGLNEKHIKRFTVGANRLLTACMKTLEKGKIGKGENSKGGIVIGSNWGNLGSGFAEEQKALFSDNYWDSSFMGILKFLSSLPTNRCSITFGLNRVSITFSGGENSGLQAIIEAARLLGIVGNIDYILAGSYEVITGARLKLYKILTGNPLKSMLFRLMLFARLCFTRGQLFKHLWKFQSREPLLLGGAGTVLIEKSDRARARGADILAVIKTYSRVSIRGRGSIDRIKEQMIHVLKVKEADAVISLYPPGKKNRRIEKKILKKINYNGKFFHGEDIAGENFSLSDIGAAAWGVSLFQFTNIRRILINSFGEFSYTGLVIEKYNG